MDVDNSNSTMPNLFDFKVTVLPSLPSPQFPPLALGYVSHLHACVGSTDTVAFYDYNWPSYGRILLTSFDKEAVINDPDCICHPRILRSSTDRHPPCYFKVQIYAVKTLQAKRQIIDEWPSINPSMPDSIQGAAPTNCVVWIHASQVDSIAYFPHAKDCINQTYGNLSGRDEMFHVDHYLIVNTNEEGPR